MAFLINNPQILVFSLLGGLVPSLFWLWFWLREEEGSEPNSLLAIVFFMGMISVIVVLPIEQLIKSTIGSSTEQVILWASAEELVKYLAVLVILYKTDNAPKPIDWPIYMITAALGFAALENTLFLIKPLSIAGATPAILAATSLGQLRFLGANLLHTVTSGTIGIAIGVSFFMGKLEKKWFLFISFIIAIALHSAFNFFIIKNNGSELEVFAFLWVVTIIVMLLFEKVRRMSGID
ncbi:MAG: PrsW family glutamic-type intramembrane protease [Candidatus Pacebacteria bacterium]|nr:PrsW family glutamic-type intramembrane protease [Candidatus Paceibacterota bacterium]